MKSINDYESINIANLLCFIVGEVDGFIEDSNGNKYLAFASTDGNKEVLKEYTKFWDGIKNSIKTKNGGKEGEYKKDFMKIRFNSDNNFPLGKIFQLCMLSIVLRFFLKKMVNIVRKCFQTNVCMSYETDVIR